MKTKIYLFLTGLLMAACFTSYGQEIVSTFAPGIRSEYSSINGVADGTLIVGSCPNASNYNRVYDLYKMTVDNTIIDTLTLNNVYNIVKVPATPEVFVASGYTFANMTWNLKLTYFDGNLNIVNETIIPIGSLGSVYDGISFLDPRDNDIIFPYSIDGAFHFMRIGLDGTIEEDKVVDGIPEGIWDYEMTSETALFYSDMGVFSNTPLMYHCLGCHEVADHDFTYVDYIMDEDFNLIETHTYEPYECITYSCTGGSAFTPINYSATSAEGYLLSIPMILPDRMAQDIVKYDIDHNPQAIKRMGVPGVYFSETQLMTTYKGHIYVVQNYIPYNFNYPRYMSLISLDIDLNTLWEFTLTNEGSHNYTAHDIKVLANGDIAISISDYSSIHSSELRTFIIRDTDPTSTPETIVSEKPYSLYPNPVKSQLTLRFDDGKEPESVELYNLAGSLVAKQCKGQKTIDMNSMSSGVYMLRVIMKDGTIYSEKVMKE